MPRKNTPRGDYYRDRANKEAEDEFFDAPAEYRKNATTVSASHSAARTAAPVEEETTSSRGKVATVIIVGAVVILALLLSAYYLLAANSKVPEIGNIMTSTTVTEAVTTEDVTLPEENALEDGTLPGESAKIVVNGTTVGNTSNAAGAAARRTTVTASATNAYVNNANNITSAQVMSMVNRSAASKGDVLIWDNILNDDSDLTQYNYTYQAAYYRATSTDEDIHAIQKNTVYTFLTCTNKDSTKEESGMLVLRSENVYNRNGLLVSEYTEGEVDSYSDASSFISSYMANKSGFTRVS